MTLKDTNEICEVFIIVASSTMTNYVTWRPFLTSNQWHALLPFVLFPLYCKGNSLALLRT